jgi:hypothetical protein
LLSVREQDTVVQTVVFMPIFGTAAVLTKGEAISAKHIITAGLYEPLCLS